MKTFSIFFIVLSIALISCEKEVIESNASKEVIVESYIQPGDSIGLELRHLLHYFGADTIVQPINDCVVTVTVNQQSYQMVFTDTGVYYLKDALIHINENDSVSMSFQFGDLAIHASTVIPTKPVNFAASDTNFTVPDFSAGFEGGSRPEMTRLSLTWENPDNSFYMVAVQPVEEDPTPISDDTLFSNNKRMFRNQPSESNSYSISPMEFRYKGKHRIILYHLNPEYAALYKFSGNTSLNISEPPTNIKNGFGIFTGMNSDTLYVNVSME